MLNSQPLSWGELTVTDGEVGDGQDHGVAGEDVVAAEVLLLAEAHPSSHSHLHHLGQDGWPGEQR